MMSGAKWCENRTWQTHHRGQLAIHASGTGPDTGVVLGTVDLIDCVHVDVLLNFERRNLRSRKSGRLVLLDRNREEAIDLARRIGDATGIPWKRLADHSSWEYVEGPFCWIVVRPIVFDEPIPAKGRLGLWNFEGEAVMA